MYGVIKMEYLTQEEVAMIFERWLKRRVLKIKDPTKFICTLCTESGYGKYLHVCNSLSQPKDSRFIFEFDAESSDDRPDIEKIRHCIEIEWGFLSEIKRSDYKKELEEIQENNT